MHVSRPPGLSPLAIVLPHPQLAHKHSSLSSNASQPSPRTPRTPSCGSSVLLASNRNSRNSTDSWNSSNGQDELEWEWKPDQIRLLSRTLDALPAHLVTPFNGPVPPSNLLDKIARGVAQAKGPIDWPHSLRATRVKLIELSRSRAKEEQAQQLVTETTHDADMGVSDTHSRFAESHGKSFPIRRPLYRQSSMDFMNAAELKENSDIACLSDRLQQRADRYTSRAAYHPYSRQNSHSPYQGRLSSPIRPGASSLMNPSTPSSSTLNSLSSLSVGTRDLRRTSSNLSITSVSSMSIVSTHSASPLVDPRVQRVKRSDSFTAPVPPPKDRKFLPSPIKEDVKEGLSTTPISSPLAEPLFLFAEGNKRPKHRKQVSYPSSDEDEKQRTQSAKKMRLHEFSSPTTPLLNTPASLPPASPPVTSVKKTKAKNTTLKTAHASSPTPHSKTPVAQKDVLSGTKNPTPISKDTSEKETKKPKLLRMNLQRNPSMFGSELPLLQKSSVSSPAPRDSPRSPAITSPLKEAFCPVSSDAHTASPTGLSPKMKTLRRVRRLAPARRISFGSLPVPEAGGGGSVESNHRAREMRNQRDIAQLGSAFQLQ